ncbi:TraB/GumN family protein [Qipengyuania mesophila]|uniref:TraB/GumN family protein n=1 Tax=Qipengyuania mesophila TaxID=2867246 RepID=UPI003516527C
MKFSATHFAWLPAVALLLQGCAATPEGEVASAPAPEIAQTQPAGRAGPALWKVADEDTTIYLFGTVHALPKGTEWYGGPIENALSGADELITEIPASAAQDPAAQQMVMSKAMLPEGETLRDQLSDTDRASYEAALGALGMPPAAFDPFEPWFAGMNLGVLPLMKEGYSAESGVEAMIEKLAPADAKRAGLESLDDQINLFDGLPEDSQIAFMMVAADNIDRIVPLMKRMVAEWMEGDADGLAELMNQGLTDQVLADALLYDRNARWADWIDTRLDSPGTVFLAVGAGHLAGSRSVQDYLASRGLSVTRVQ